MPSKQNYDKDKRRERLKKSVERWIRVAKKDRLIEKPKEQQISKHKGKYKRWEDEVIVKSIPYNAFVLDLGCGDGTLLKELKTIKNVKGQGVELNTDKVKACVEKGVPVFQTEILEGLKGLPDKAYDYIILEETLQTLKEPHYILDEMLRVGRKVIVSFPNFGFWRVRLNLFAGGRMPVTETLPFKWYNTPNIHMLTLQDFIDWIKNNNVKIVEGFVLNENNISKLNLKIDNLYAEGVIVTIERTGQIKSAF